MARLIAVSASCGLEPGRCRCALLGDAADLPLGSGSLLRLRRATRHTTTPTHMCPARNLASAPGVKAGTGGETNTRAAHCTGGPGPSAPHAPSRDLKAAVHPRRLSLLAVTNLRVPTSSGSGSRGPGPSDRRQATSWLPRGRIRHSAGHRSSRSRSGCTERHRAHLGLVAGMDVRAVLPGQRRALAASFALDTQDAGADGDAVEVDGRAVVGRMDVFHHLTGAERAVLASDGSAGDRRTWPERGSESDGKQAARGCR